MNKWGLSGSGFFRTWVHMKSVWWGPGQRGCLFPWLVPVLQRPPCAWGEAASCVYPVALLDERFWLLGPWLTGPWQCSLSCGFFFSHGWLEKEINKHLGVVARSWFLTFACCGFMLILNRTRGQLRFILYDQECFTCFLRSKLNSLFAWWALFHDSLSKRTNNLKNQSKCVMSIFISGLKENNFLLFYILSSICDMVTSTLACGELLALT